MSDGVPQFATAEYSGNAGEATCKACGKGIGDPYYQINGAKVCSNCAQTIKEQIPQDSMRRLAAESCTGSEAQFWVSGSTSDLPWPPGWSRAWFRSRSDGSWARRSSRVQEESAAAATNWPRRC